MAADEDPDAELQFLRQALRVFHAGLDPDAQRTLAGMARGMARLAEMGAAFAEIAELLGPHVEPPAAADFRETAIAKAYRIATLESESLSKFLIGEEEPRMAKSKPKPKPKPKPPKPVY